MFLTLFCLLFGVLKRFRRFLAIECFETDPTVVQSLVFVYFNLIHALFLSSLKGCDLKIRFLIPFARIVQIYIS